MAPPMVIGVPLAAPPPELLLDAAPVGVLAELEAGPLPPLLLHPEIVTTAAVRIAKIAPADMGFLVM
jgi:hypothetical protein